MEQEICYRSETFLYAAGSSWSLNIVMERHAHNINIDKSEENINLLYRVLKKLKEEGWILGLQENWKKKITWPSKIPVKNVAGGRCILGLVIYLQLKIAK